MALAAEFHELFRGHEQAHGVYIIKGKNTDKNKVNGKARTLGRKKPAPVTDTLWVEHLKGNTGLGIIPINEESMCRFGAIDIDIYDGLDFKQVETQLKELKIPLVMCKTKSGGLHLYLFTNEPVPAKLVRDKLKEWSVILGHGNAEIFPKQNELRSSTDIGSWINMPYFNANKTDRYGIHKGKKLTPQRFIDYAKVMSMDRTQLENTTVEVDDIVRGAPPCIKTIWITGLDAHSGMRDKGLFNVCLFLKRKYPDDWMDKAEDWFKEGKLDQFPRDQFRKTVRSVEEKEYSYTCDDLNKWCNREICEKEDFGIGSGGPGVELTNLRKYYTAGTGEIVRWLVSVDGEDLTIEDTNSLQQFKNFQRICMERLSKVPRSCKVVVWEQILSSLFDQVEEVELAQDLGIDGQVLEYFQQWLSVGLVNTMDGLLMNQAVMIKGKIYFTMKSFIDYLKQQKVQYTSKQAGPLLMDHYNAKKGRPSVKGQLVRIFEISADAVDLQTEEFDEKDPEKGGF
jgi:hypothetical protein